jgi:heme exporter protein D
MNMSEFLHMGGYGFYVWSSYIVTALVLVCELLSLRARLQRARGRSAGGTTTKEQAR